METTTLLDLITKFLPLIILIISTFIINPFKDFIRNLWRRKTTESDILKDYEQKIEKLDNEFLSFVKDDIRERYFFYKTGIKTNARSIEKYIMMKGELGNNFTWKSLKETISFMKFQNGKIIIRTKGYQKIIAKLITVVGLLFILLGIGVFTYFSNELHLFGLKEFIQLLTLTTFPIFTGIYLLFLIAPLCTAIAMEKKIDSLEREKLSV